MSRVFVDFKVKNLGNGPAVEIDFIPKLVSKLWDATLRRPNGKATELVDGLGKRIECISLKEGDSQKVSFIFFDEEVRFANSLLTDLVAYVACEVIFKNVLGMTFRETFNFRVMLNNYDKESEILKLCLKTAKTAEIDFGEKIREFESLLQKERKDEADKIFDAVREEIKIKFKGCEELLLDSDLSPGSFSVSTISQNDYERKINEMNARYEKIIFGPKTA